MGSEIFTMFMLQMSYEIFIMFQIFDVIFSYQYQLLKTLILFCEDIIIKSLKLILIVLFWSLNKSFL